MVGGTCCWQMDRQRAGLVRLVGRWRPEGMDEALVGCHASVDQLLAARREQWAASTVCWQRSNGLTRETLGLRNIWFSCHQCSIAAID